MSLNSIAFIPDGNRRYARKVGVNYAKSYQLGTRKAWEVIDWLKEYPQIKAGTFYTLSLENLEDVLYVATFRGKNIAAGKKSVTLRLRFRDASRTLTHEEVNDPVSTAIEALVEKCGAEIRS